MKCNSNSSNDFFILILIVITFPNILVSMSLVARLISDGVIWYQAIIGGYIWPFFAVDLIYDDMLLKLLEMVK